MFTPIDQGKKLVSGRATIRVLMHDLALGDAPTIAAIHFATLLFVGYPAGLAG